MDAEQITADLAIKELLRVHLCALRVLIQRRMACVGCEVAPFHTIAEAARIYGIPVEALVRDLREAAVEVEAE